MNLVSDGNGVASSLPTTGEFVAVVSTTLTLRGLRPRFGFASGSLGKLGSTRRGKRIKRTYDIVLVGILL